MSPYLPNTYLTSLSTGSKVYCYAQSYHGELIELEGRIGMTKKDSDVYIRENQTNIGMTVRYRQDDDDDDDDDGAMPSHVPKMFTPLAAASLGNTRYLIYVNDANILHDIVFKDGSWQKGNLCNLKGADGKTGVRCAAYSKLAAATVKTRDGQDIFCVYYQADGIHGPVRMISFIPGQSWHFTFWPGGSMTAEWRDPPLYGTSLTAVKPRKGINVAEDENEKQYPVVYLQWDTQALAECQGLKIQPIPGLETFQLSPHTSLTAVDDGSNLYIFYKTNDNVVHMVRVGDGKAIQVAANVAIPTPRSAIAAVMPLKHKNRVVLFYQRWGKGRSEKVDIKAKTLKLGSAGVWELTTETNVLSG